jgi:sRNA-binding protein
MEQGSQLARDIARIDLELEAAGRLEHDFAISARHDFINARMQRGGERILQLIDEGKHEEAQALMNTDNWGIAEENKTIKGRQKRERKGYKKRSRGYKKIIVGRAEDETSRKV